MRTSRLTILAIAAFVAMVLGGCSTTATSDQPCPELSVSNGVATIKCDDGEASFDTLELQEGKSYWPGLMAGSHQVRQIIIVGDELRVVYDPVLEKQGATIARITLLDTTSGEVRTMGY